MKESTVPAPHPPGFQPGVAHGIELNASVASGDTKKNAAKKLIYSAAKNAEAF